MSPMLDQIEAIIFDMDGVIIESESHWHAIESSFLKEILDSWSSELQKSILGMSVYDVHRLLQEKYGLKLSQEEFLNYYNSLAEQLYGEQALLIDGVPEVLELLKSRKLPLALASSSPKKWIDIVLQRFEFEKYFSAVSSSDDVKGRCKPDPEIYLFTAKELKITPEKCLAIEDTEKGIQSAKSAGMKVIGFRNTLNSKQNMSKADLEIEGHENLAGLLLATISQ